MRTKPGTIRAQLLFKSGDRYRAQKLAETERNLRMLLYVYDARVVPVHYADGKVDVKVITKDVWTLSPGDLLRARRRHRTPRATTCKTTNFLGWGKTVQISHSSNVDRTSNTIDYADPNVFGSRWTSALCLRPFERRAQRAALFAQPFYSLDTRWSAKISGAELRSHRVALLTSATSSINSTTMKRPMN